MGVVEIIAQIVQIIATFLKPSDPCPLCAARAANPVVTGAIIDAANAAADAAENAKFGAK